ncbi:MAG: S8 family serine peptidase [Planctomycetota bacterium]|nr:S8 family serine peptidase [Planctomycetota bacterium]
MLMTLMALCGTALAQTSLPHEFVVRLVDGETIEDVAESHNAQILARFDAQRLYLLHSDPFQPDDDQNEVELGADDRFEHVERNYDNSVADGHTQSFFVSTAPSSFLQQPCWDRIGLPLAPAIYGGTKITVAVLDTGVNLHARFASRVRLDGADFIGTQLPTVDLPTGVDTNGNGRLDDLAGHGTFIAGLISQVAPGCRILPIRVLDSDGVGSTYSTVCGMYYAVSRGAKVINVSLGGVTDSPLFHDAIAAAAAAGAVVVSASGNTGSSAPQYPAAVPGAVAVASLSLDNTLSPWSCYGSYVMFAAPGTDIVSTFGTDGYARASGTSMSSALVAGCVARMKSCLPSLGSAAITAALLNMSQPIDDCNPDHPGEVGRAVRLDRRWPVRPDSVQTIVRGPK